MVPQKAVERHEIGVVAREADGFEAQRAIELISRRPPP
jgi:hypothetical protein